jgi:hypothetical protein
MLVSRGPVQRAVRGASDAIAHASSPNSRRPVVLRRVPPARRPAPGPAGPRVRRCVPCERRGGMAAKVH